MDIDHPLIAGGSDDEEAVTRAWQVVVMVIQGFRDSE